MSGAAFHDRRFRAAAAGLTVIYLWFVSAQPLVAVAGAGLDDRLFVELANQILTGHWLGDYNQFTLAKGAGYPIFIALSFVAGIPFPLAEHLLYILGSWMIVRAIRPLVRHDAWTLLLFAGLIWQPMGFVMPDPWGGSVLRQQLYTPLTLLIFAGLIGLHTRQDRPAYVRAGWAALLGLSSGWFWITREEGVWILPSVILLLGVSLVVAWHRGNGYWRSSWPWAMAAVALALPVGTVSALNAHYYGWFGECEFHNADFRDAYGSLMRVKAGPPMLRIPVTRKMRPLLYQASPTFASMRDLMEHTIPSRWAGAEDREINGAMWMWALRDAVRESGHDNTPTEAFAFYRRIAAEVNASCDAGKVPAGPYHSSFLPPWSPEYTQEAKSVFWAYLRCFVLWQNFRARPPLSETSGDANLLLIFRDMAQWPVSPSVDAPAFATPRAKAFRAWRIGALQSIGDTLKWVIVAATTLGALTWLFHLGTCVIRRRWPVYLWWLASAALGGAFVVFLVAFLVDVTSWSDWRPLRFAQGYPLLVLFAGAAIMATMGAAKPVPAQDSSDLRASEA